MDQWFPDLWQGFPIFMDVVTGPKQFHKVTHWGQRSMRWLLWLSHHVKMFVSSDYNVLRSRVLML